MSKIFGGGKTETPALPPPPPPPLPPPPAPTRNDAANAADKDKGESEADISRRTGAGRASTILTSGEGDTTEAPVKKKTLLGS